MDLGQENWVGKPRRGSIESRIWRRQGPYTRLLIIIVQQNYVKWYDCTISALEAWLGPDAAVVCIQEPLLGNGVFLILDLICIGFLQPVTGKTCES